MASVPVGTGNSPPTRKWPASPETAVRFGSARVRTRPTRSKACNMPVAWFTALLPAVVWTVAVSPFTPVIGLPLAS